MRCQDSVEVPLYTVNDCSICLVRFLAFVSDSSVFSVFVYFRALARVFFYIVRKRGTDLVQLNGE